MPAPTPVTTPTIAPSTNPTPWQEQFTDPSEICDQQRREGASPDLPV